MAAKKIYFVKEYEDSLVIGLLTGKPNKDGEQDYKGYSVGPTSFEVIKGGEDFLSEDEVARVKEEERDTASAKDYEEVEQLYTELLALVKGKGLNLDSEEYIALEELEEAEADGGTIREATNLIGRAYNIISTLL